MARIEIARAELVWRGKYDASGAASEVPRVGFPFRVVEVIGEGQAPAGARQAGQAQALAGFGGQPAGAPADRGWRNRLILGDNLLAMGSLLGEYAGKVDLVYVDPPFATGTDFAFRAEVGGEGAEAARERAFVEGAAYRDTWGGGIDAYLQMMYDRLRLMRELLKETGSIYVHLDARVSHYVRLILDEVFGPAAFQREIVWRIGWVSGYKSAARNWIRNHDTILFYVATPGRFTFNKEYVPYPPGYRRRGQAETQGKGYPVEDVWNASPLEFELAGDDSLDSIQIRSFSREKTGWATQKNESLLRRIIRVSSNPGDLVADFFCGSGTTVAVAEKLGRRWIGCDLSPLAIHTARKRLLGVQGCRPFEILDLGEHERRRWHARAFGDASEGVARGAGSGYVALILGLYGAQPLAGLAHLHGTKGGAMVHVGKADAPVTVDEVEAAIVECGLVRNPELHVLGWEWETGLQERVAACRGEHGIRLALIQIPRDVMDGEIVEGRGVRFRELPHLDAETQLLGGLAVKVSLKGFASPDSEAVREKVGERVSAWSDLIDFWAVDWDFRGGAFVQGWAACRTRDSRKLPLASPPHAYREPGRYRVVVKAADVFGNSASRALDVEV